MMRLLFVFVFLSGVAFGQFDNEIDFYPNGNKKSEKYEKDNYDFYYSWYENGQLECQKISLNNSIIQSIFWFKNGQIRVLTQFGEINKNAKIKTEVVWDGLRIEWYENGKIRCNKYYKDEEIINENCYDINGKEISCN